MTLARVALANLRIGDMLVIRETGTRAAGQPHWLVRCSGGHEFRRGASDLRKAHKEGRRIYCRECESARRQRERDLATKSGKKKCIDCKDVKPLAAFYTHQSGIGGRQSRCKACEGNRDRGVVDGRPTNNLCRVCGSQTWRVVGGECKKCGLKFAEQAPLTIADVQQRPHACRLVYSE